MVDTRYVLEVTNHLNGTLKTVFLDRTKVYNENGFGIPALQLIRTFPITLTEEEKDYVLQCLHKAPYREMEDGRKALPEIITRFGGMILPTRMVKFEVKVFKVTSNGSITTTEIEYLQKFVIEGREGSGVHNRHLTNYSIKEVNIEQGEVATA